MQLIIAKRDGPIQNCRIVQTANQSRVQAKQHNKPRKSIKMHDQCQAKFRRLSIWFAINLIIFISCYLNYRFQLKHRYLYKTLSVGLCLSRAAAMVINFNLILVWIPMCKYTLTRLAFIACSYNRRQRIKLNNMISIMGLSARSTKRPEVDDQRKDAISYDHEVSFGATYNAADPKIQQASRSGLFGKFKIIARRSYLRARCLISSIRIKAINSFLVAVDHSTSLHTISATTITLASVIHTVAHLMNVINFSNNFDPLLGNLNMAEYKGQNPTQLLVSVPGITGCFMILILILMSLSSISAIRNSSFDLFQIFHRLSVLFVILLILHPSSHVLKEQNNVERHNPDICYDEMIDLRNEILPARANQSIVLTMSSNATGLHALPRTRKSSVNREMTAVSPNSVQINHIDLIEKNRTPTEQKLNSIKKRDISNHDSSRERLISTENHVNLKDHATPEEQESSPCRDIVPTFVAQSSICWYVLGTGLSCYLMDLILRRLRRNKNPIELLDARSDAEGNLIELTLSNNHARFAHWLPGQFVYLNCPQIATFEWHPFTISSMDNRSRQFTLHIKTGGDWTRKLRNKLKLEHEQQQQQQQQQYQQHSGHQYSEQSYNGCNSMSLFSRGASYSIGHCCRSQFRCKFDSEIGAIGQTSIAVCGGGKLGQGIRLASFDCHDEWSGQFTAQCKASHAQKREDNEDEEASRKQVHLCDRTKIHTDNLECRGSHPIWSLSSFVHEQTQLDNLSSLLSYHTSPASMRCSGLDFFIDGPFHSPFERLLEQQVSICIASGVGWTAFSSVFQQITYNSFKNLNSTKDDDWWSQWRDHLVSTKSKPPYAVPSGDILCSMEGIASTGPISLACSQKRQSTSETNLHLMVIVTSIEQLKPFYNIVMKYYALLDMDHHNRARQQSLNCVREITAFVTRSSGIDADVLEFCDQENLSPCYDRNGPLAISDRFTVRFGKPNFTTYLGGFSTLYKNKSKVSIYCCGSHEVKRTVERTCKDLNKNLSSLDDPKPVYCYHEENF